jgi:hypothetical protein
VWTTFVADYIQSIAFYGNSPLAGVCGSGPVLFDEESGDVVRTYGHNSGYCFGMRVVQGKLVLDDLRPMMND